MGRFLHSESLAKGKCNFRDANLLQYSGKC